MSPSSEYSGKRVILIYFGLFFLGGLAAAAGGVYLYLHWERHFPPMGELQAQLRAAREIPPAEEEAEEEFEERTGIGAWMDELEGRYSRQGEEALSNLEEVIEEEPLPPLVEAATGSPGLVVPEVVQAERAAAVEKPAERTVPVPRAPEPKAQPVVDKAKTESPKAPPAGTIEPMEDDWLPPGVSRVEK